MMVICLNIFRFVRFWCLLGREKAPAGVARKEPESTSGTDSSCVVVANDVCGCLGWLREREREKKRRRREVLVQQPGR